MRLFNLSHSFASFLNVNYRTLYSPSVGSELDCNPYVSSVKWMSYLSLFIYFLKLFYSIWIYLNYWNMTALPRASTRSPRCDEVLFVWNGSWFLGLRSQKTHRILEQIMTADKYPCVFSREIEASLSIVVQGICMKIRSVNLCK